MEKTMSLIENVKANFGAKYFISYDDDRNVIRIKCKKSTLSSAIIVIENNTVEFGTIEFVIVKKHYDDENVLIRELPLFLQTVLGVFFVEKDGVPDMIMHRLQDENFESETQKIINEYVAEGVKVVAIEYYALNHIPPRLVADKITHAYLVKLLENRFSKIKAYFPDAEEGTRYKNSEFDTDERAIDDSNPLTDWDRALFIPSKSCPKKIIAVQSDLCKLGNIFDSIYLFPFDSFYALPLDSETMTNVYPLLQQIHLAYFGDKL